MVRARAREQDDDATPQPLGDRLILRALSAPTQVGQLWLPPSAAEANFAICQAEVVARGPEVEDWRLAPGVRVVCRRFGGAPLDEDAEQWAVFEHDVLAILR